MLVTKCFGHNYKMLATVLAILVNGIHYLFTLASGQHPKDVTNIEILSPTPQNRHQREVTKITTSPTSLSPVPWYTIRYGLLTNNNKLLCTFKNPFLDLRICKLK